MKQPFFIDWALTTRCNLSCAHCRGMVGPDMSENRAISLASEMVALAPDWVIVEGGEPLLHPRLWDLLAVFSRAGLRHYLITNGMLIQTEQAQRLRSLGTKVMVSMESPVAAEYEIYRPGASFGRLLKTCQILAGHGLLDSLNMTLFKDNLGVIGALFELGRTLGCANINLITLKNSQPQDGRKLSGLDYHRAVTACQEASQRYGLGFFFDEPFFEVLQASTGRKVSPDNDCGIVCSRRMGCIFGQYLFVEPDGQVRPCTFSPVVFGQAAEESLLKIWEAVSRDERVVAVQDRSRRQGKCQSCLQVERCGGCRSRAYTATGDWLAADPGCPC